MKTWTSQGRICDGNDGLSLKTCLPEHTLRGLHKTCQTCVDQAFYMGGNFHTAILILRYTQCKTNMHPAAIRIGRFSFSSNILFTKSRLSCTTDVVPLEIHKSQ